MLSTQSSKRRQKLASWKKEEKEEKEEKEKKKEEDKEEKEKKKEEKEEKENKARLVEELAQAQPGLHCAHGGGDGFRLLRGSLPHLRPVLFSFCSITKQNFVFSFMAFGGSAAVSHTCARQTPVSFNMFPLKHAFLNYICSARVGVAYSCVTQKTMVERSAPAQIIIIIIYNTNDGRAERKQ